MAAHLECRATLEALGHHPVGGELHRGRQRPVSTTPSTTTRSSDSRPRRRGQARLVEHGRAELVRRRGGCRRAQDDLLQACQPGHHRVGVGVDHRACPSCIDSPATVGPRPSCSSRPSRRRSSSRAARTSRWCSATSAAARSPRRGRRASELAEDPLLGPAQPTARLRRHDERADLPVTGQQGDADRASPVGVGPGAGGVIAAPGRPRPAPTARAARPPRRSRPAPSTSSRTRGGHAPRAGHRREGVPPVPVHEPVHPGLDTGAQRMHRKRHDRRDHARAEPRQDRVRPWRAPRRSARRPPPRATPAG